MGRVSLDLKGAKMSKVRANETHDGMYTKGRIYDVVERVCPYNHLYIKTDTGSICSVTRKYFTPIDESELERHHSKNSSGSVKLETELDRLVHIANEGIEAFLKLKREYLNKVEYLAHPKSRDAWVLLESGHFPYLDWDLKLRVPQKPKFEPFTVGSGWQVKLEGDTLHIGCQDFNAKEFRRAVKHSEGTGFDCFQLKGEDMSSGRAGVEWKGHKLSWIDADKILAALEQAGIK